MNRSLVVATDGSPAAQSALRYALDFAVALRIREITCVCVHDEGGSPKGSIVPTCVGTEMALGAAAGGLKLLDQPDLQQSPPVDPGSVLDVCAREVTAAGVRCKAVRATGVPSDCIVQLGDTGEATFLGRNSDSTPTPTRHFGFTASNVLQRICHTLVLCPASYARVERVVLVLAGGQGDAELVARAGTWAGALRVPVHVAVSGSGPSFSTQAGRAAQTVLASEGLSTSGECYSCRPEEYVETLRPGDLVLVARHPIWRVPQVRFGTSTDRIAARAPGVVAVVV